MEQQKLTPQIAAAYYGCEAYEWDNGRKQKFPCVIDSESMDRLENVDVDMILILHPLSDITPADALKCAEIAGILDTHIGEIVPGQSGCTKICGINAKGNPRTLTVYHTPSNARVIDNGFEVIEYCLPIFDFLRSRGYDCGYANIPSLIAAEIAVKA